MATVSLSSAIYNASTQKYLVVLENAILIKNDKNNNRLTIELEQKNVSLRPPTPRPNRNPLSFSQRCPVKPLKSTTIIVKNTNQYKHYNKTFSFNERDKIKLIKKAMIHDTNDMNHSKDEYEPIHSMQMNINDKFKNITNDYVKNRRLSQSETSPMSVCSMNVTDPIYKANQIKRLLKCTNLMEKEVAMTLPSKYEDKYKLIDIEKKPNGGLQGDINAVRSMENGQKYAMKSMKYKNMYELRRYLQRYLTVYQYKFMHYKDIFVDTKDKKLHIIQPFLKQTLQEKLCSLKNRKFDNKELKSVILQLIKKMDGMHSMGYIHHDLKPSNIMFDENNMLHIIDFDLMEKVGSKITTKGTIGFIAPEMFIPLLDKTGKRKISSKRMMDIWSIGSIICYMSFKGRIPFNYFTENNDKKIKSLTEYMNEHSFLNENSYRENKWSFVIDVQMDYDHDYDPELFQLISDLLSFNGNIRPNTSALLTSRQYSWFNQAS